MFIVSSERTTASARQFVQDRGIDLRRPPSRRAKVVELAQRWAEAQQRKAEHDRRIRDMLRRAAEREAWRLEQAKALADRLAVQKRASAPYTITEMVAAWHGFTADQIMSKSRNRKLCEARFDAIAAVATTCMIDGRPPSLGDLGRVFNRDHTTILHAFRMRGIRSPYVSKGTRKLRSSAHLRAEH